MKWREEQRHTYRPISRQTKRGGRLGSCSPRSLVSRDGREEFRKLDAESRPTYRDRQVALLKRIMHPHLNSAGSGAENIDKLSEWIGKERDQTVKTATLMEETPPELQEHLRLRSEGIGTDYKKVVQAIEAYMRSKKTWDSGGPVDVDIGAVNKGKCQPKSKARARAKVEATRAKDSPEALGK